MILIKLQSNYIKITLQHGYSPGNLLHISRAPLCKNTFGGLLLNLHFVSISLIYNEKKIRRKYHKKKIYKNPLNIHRFKEKLLKNTHLRVFV